VTLPPAVSKSRSPNPGALLVAGVVLLLVIDTFLAWLLYGQGDSGASEAYRAGQQVGAAISPLLWTAIVYLIARAVSGPKTRAAKYKIAFWTLLVFLVGTMAQLGARGATMGSTAVTPAERSGLAESADSIWHPGFGFVLPHPGSGFMPAPELQSRLDSQLVTQPEIVAWVRRRPGRPELLIVEVMKFRRINETGLRTFAASFRRSAFGKTQRALLEDTVTWNAREGEYRAAAQTAAGVFLKVRCVASRSPTPALIVCVQTLSDDLSRFDDVRSGLVVHR
jgi:hypothetical protein